MMSPALAVNRNDRSRSTPNGDVHVPYLGNEVQLTEEREKHIAEHHPDLLSEHRDKIAGTLADPDELRRSVRFAGARVFSNDMMTCVAVSLSLWWWLRKQGRLETGL
jgi:hypothetical protein